jgi:hypothetical protein
LTEAVQTVIGEFKTLSPDITRTAVFKLDGETLAVSEGTTLEQTQTLIANLSSITHSECIGGIESLTIQDLNNQLAISAVGDVYLALVSSRTADQKIIRSLSQIVAPTVIQLALGHAVVAVEKPKIQQNTLETAMPSEKEPEIAPITEPESPPEPYLPKAPTTQFMVEKISGLLIASDTVRIDNEVIENWQNLYDKKTFTALSIETLEGKTVTCKFKPQKDAKGIIGIPDKILQSLQCSKGKLVMVKPVIE